MDRPERGCEVGDGPEVQDSDPVSAVEGATAAAAEDDDAVRKDVSGGGRSY